MMNRILTHNFIYFFNTFNWLIFFRSDIRQSTHSFCCLMQHFCLNFDRAHLGRSWQTLNGFHAETIGGLICYILIISLEEMSPVCNMLGTLPLIINWSFLAPSFKWSFGSSQNGQNPFLQPHLWPPFWFQPLLRTNISLRAHSWHHRKQLGMLIGMMTSITQFTYHFTRIWAVLYLEWYLVCCIASTNRATLI